MSRGLQLRVRTCRQTTVHLDANLTRCCLIAKARIRPDHIRRVHPECGLTLVYMVVHVDDLLTAGSYATSSQQICVLQISVLLITQMTEKLKTLQAKNCTSSSWCCHGKQNHVAYFKVPLLALQFICSFLHIKCRGSLQSY